MRFLKEVLVALLTGFVIAAVAASVGVKHLATVLWIGAGSSAAVLGGIVMVDRKRPEIARLVNMSPVALQRPVVRRRSDPHLVLPPAVGTDPVRIALYAVRTELAACGTRIVEALERKQWWNPDVEKGDPLPAIAWRDHAGALSDPSLPPELHQKIEGAYQKCDRLNHKIRGYIAAEVASHPFSILLVPSFAFRHGDEELIRAGLKLIAAANTAITERVG